jgi:hypothetical protein
MFWEIWQMRRSETSNLRAAGRVGMFLVACYVCGCTQNQKTIQNSSRANVGVADERIAYQAALATMREHFRIETDDPRRGLIRSAPSSAPRPDRPILTPLNVPPGTQRRRIAEMRIQPRDDGTVLASCSVLVQENQIAPRRALEFQGRIDDLPGRTPLEESEGFQETDDAVWATRDRDTVLERELLAALRERLSKSQSDEDRSK